METIKVTVESCAYDRITVRYYMYEAATPLLQQSEKHVAQQDERVNHNCLTSLLHLI